MNQTAPDRCFHCGESCGGKPLLAAIEAGGPALSFCCAGCEAAAMFIQGAGLADFYRLRSTGSNRPDASTASFAEWDSLAVRRMHVREVDGRAEISLPVAGLRCAACTWLIERALGQIPGVLGVSSNLPLARLKLSFRPDQVALSTLIAQLAALGFSARLPENLGNAAQAKAEQRDELKRLAVAGLGMMQVMMFAEPLYFAAFGQPLEPATRDFFRWIGLLLSAPVLFYSGAGFLHGAARELRYRQLGMDTLVATALLLAYGASVVETLRGGAEVYFDSVVMFVFFLLLGRVLERSARRRARSQVELLAQSQPAVAHRVRGGEEQLVAIAELEIGDQVRVYPGAAVPADGHLLDPNGALDEALLTGESEPVRKNCGAPVYAGSVVVERPLLLAVDTLGTNTVLQRLLTLIDQAQQSRPRLAQLAERWSRHFAAGLLLLSAVVAAVWSVLDPSRALAITLSTLAVACPCALALAVPAALIAAQSRLSRSGVLLLRGQALETLSRIDRIVFDKTGTLTSGQPVIASIRTFNGITAEHAKALAAALEAGSSHPLAQAFRSDAAVAPVEALVQHTGLGIEGIVHGRRLRLGRPEYVAELCHSLPDGLNADALVLGEASGLLASFAIRESLRPDAVSVIEGLRQRGLAIELLSGDGPRRVAEVARALDINEARSRQSPAAKLAAVRVWQAQGSRVAMVGDGINDGPVLAGADVSIALAHGAAAAHRAADLVLLGNRLDALPAAIEIAQRTLQIIRQNLLWAVGYNLVGIGLAACGWMPPWLAALGMSLSSLLVTLNALRIQRPLRVRQSALAAAPRPTPMFAERAA